MFGIVTRISKSSVPGESEIRETDAQVFAGRHLVLGIDIATGGREFQGASVGPEDQVGIGLRQIIPGTGEPVSEADTLVPGRRGECPGRVSRSRGGVSEECGPAAARWPVHIGLLLRPGRGAWGRTWGRRAVPPDSGGWSHPDRPPRPEPEPSGNAWTSPVKTRTVAAPASSTARPNSVPRSTTLLCGVSTVKPRRAVRHARRQSSLEKSRRTRREQLEAGRALEDDPRAAVELDLRQAPLEPKRFARSHVPARLLLGPCPEAILCIDQPGDIRGRRLHRDLSPRRGTTTVSHAANAGHDEEPSRQARRSRSGPVDASPAANPAPSSRPHPSEIRSGLFRPVRELLHDRIGRPAVPGPRNGSPCGGGNSRRRTFCASALSSR